MSIKKCLLLVGSPRGLQSTSYKIGDYLLNKLIEKGFTAETYILKTLHNPDKDKLESFIQTVLGSDIIILSSPLYVDSIPSFVIETMELISKKYQNIDSEKEQRFLAIINSGFPESNQNDIAIRICRRFASEVNYEWAGGIKVGGGSAVGNQELEGNKGMLKKFVRELDLVAEAIATREKLPEDASKILDKSLAPKWMYYTILNIGWWLQARKNNAQKKLFDKPYQNE